MDSILVINAGSSSVKFQVFATDGKRSLDRLIKGQVDGIGTNPRLRASAADGSILIDKNYAANEIADVPAALSFAGDWLRRERKLALMAVGHRVVHGGPRYDRPVLIDAEVLANLERLVSLAPLHQPNNLAPIRAILARNPELPQVACFDTAFHRSHDALADHYAIPEPFSRRGRPALWIPRPVLRVHRRPPQDGSARDCGWPGDRGASRQRCFDVRARGRPQRRELDGLYGA